MDTQGQRRVKEVKRIIGEKKTVLLHFVFYTLSVGHLLNILVEKPSRQLDIRFETQPRKNQAR